MIGHRLRASVLGVALVMTVATVPESLLATLAPSDDGATYGLGSELSRLGEVRERLVRERALERALKQRADSLAREIDDLQTRREQTRGLLRSERDQASMLERQLDRVVPRVLARRAMIHERLARAARLLADLASTSRRVELDPTIRARMLAISPLLLRRLRGAEAGLGPLERRTGPVIAQQQEIARRTPLLMAETQRLQRQWDQQQQQRHAVVTRLGRLTAQVQELSLEQQRLAEAVLSNEVAHEVRAGPGPDQPALGADVAVRAAGDVEPDATVKGSLAEPSGLGFGVQAIQPNSPQLMAAAPPAGSSTGPGLTAHAALAALPPPAKPIDAARQGVLSAAAYRSADGATPLDAVFLDPAPLADVGSQVPVARLPRPPAPLMPVPGEALNPFGDQGKDPNKPGITIVALPGQAVAAPEAGRVVFAAPFRSYGLLLIIEHQREYHTLLWGLADLDVKVGDQVRAGQVVGVMAADGDRPPELHVELRRNGRPVNPLPWLAASSNKVRG
jgi:murein DD-endopeptidase MepM/ murein hydrolase activator NlpD